MLVAVLFAFLLSANSASAQERNWLERAQTALQHGDLAAARSAASERLAAFPNTADAEVVLGLVETAENHLPAAAEHFGRAVALQPDNYRAHAYLGSTYLRQQRVAEARKSFENVLAHNPGNIVAHYNLGLIAMLARNPAAALPHFSAVVKANASDTAALIGLLECQLDLKQDAAADASAHKLATLLPNNSPELLQVATVLANHGQYSAALPLFRKVVTAHPDAFDAHFNLALALYRTDALEEAASELQALVARTPKGEAFNLLGGVEEKRGHPDEALRAFEQAARIAPDSEDFAIDYGSALINAGDLNGAVAVFTKAARSWPGSLRSLLGLASADYLAGKHEECAKTLLAGIAAHPDASALYDLLGKTFEAVPALQPAIKDAFAQYLATGPKDPVAYAHFGTMLYVTAAGEGAGRFAKSKEQLHRAISLKPQLAEAHLQLGIIAQAENNLPAALGYYQRAAALAPGWSAARYRLGSLYGKLGNREKAQAELDQFRKLKASEARQERELMMQSLSNVPK